MKTKTMMGVPAKRLRLLELVADLASENLATKKEVRKLEGVNADLRSQNKFLVTDNARLEANLKKLEAKYKKLFHAFGDLNALLDEAGIATVDEDGNPGIRFMGEHQATGIDLQLLKKTLIDGFPVPSREVDTGISHVDGHQIASTDFVGLDLSEAAELAAQALTSGTKRSEPLPFRNLVTQPAPKEQP